MASDRSKKKGYEHWGHFEALSAKKPLQNLAIALQMY